MNTAADIGLIKNLLSDCGLREPASKEFKRHQAKRKSVNYRRILSSLGKYSLMIGISVTLFFLGKKLTTLVSIKAVAAVLILSSAAVPLIISRSFLSSGAIPQETTIAAQKQSPAAAAGKARHSLVFKGFATTSADDETIRKADGMMMDCFRSRMGGDFAVRSKGTDNTFLDTDGTIEKLGSVYYVMFKIVDTRTSAVRYVTKKTAHSEAEMAEVCAQIASETQMSLR